MGVGSSKFLAVCVPELFCLLTDFLCLVLDRRIGGPDTHQFFRFCSKITGLVVSLQCYDTSHLFNSWFDETIMSQIYDVKLGKCNEPGRKPFCHKI